MLPTIAPSYVTYRTEYFVPGFSRDVKNPITLVRSLLEKHFNHRGRTFSPKQRMTYVRGVEEDPTSYSVAGVRTFARVGTYVRSTYVHHAQSVKPRGYSTVLGTT